MKCVQAVAAGAALLWLTGCASVSRVVVTEPVGPGPAASPAGSGEGSLVLYSARTPAGVDVCQEEWRWNNDFGKNEFLHPAAHGDYVIYARNGQLVQPVRNARDGNDGTPTVVALPAGTYQVEAEGINCDSDRVRVLLTVVIQPGQTTLAHLDGAWNPPGPYRASEVAKLPCGRIIGWRAGAAELASNAAGQPTP